MTNQHKPTVVVGISHDHPHQATLEWAAYIASERGATLHAVTAHPVSPRLADGLAELERKVREDQAQILAPLRAAYPDLEITSELSWVLPAEAVRLAAREADLVVVGARDSSFWGELVDSTSRPVAASALCPVIVVPEEGAAPARTERRIVLAVDESAPSRDAAQFAFAQAEVWGAPVTALHARAPMRPLPVLAAPPPVETDPQAAADEVFAELLEPLAEQYPDVDVTRTLVREEIVDALTETASEQDLIVVGSRGRGNLIGLLFGSVSRDVLGRSTGPVAVVTEGDLHRTSA